VTASSAARTAYGEELSQRARTSALVITAIAVLIFPAWNGFDQLLEPQHAREFLIARLLAEIPMLTCLWLLWARPIGRRRPELLSFVVLAVVQVEIAWMVVQATDARDAYLLGFSLALFGSGCILAGRARWTARVVAVSWAAFAVALLASPDPYPAKALATAGFYLTTASIIAVISHLHRDRLADRELAARAELDREQDHTRELLGRLERLSHEDPLTGLANRRRWDTELARVCSQAGRTNSEVAVVLIDIDRFKEINDRLGHACGDEALRKVAGLLSSRARLSDLVARVGGDELGVLLLDCDAAAATEVAEQLRVEALELRLLEEVTLSLSLGVATAVGRNAQPADLMQRADEQMYRAKATRNSVATAAAVAVATS
jgi:diguanylate cyclase (GGDEF)-like protein